MGRLVKSLAGLTIAGSSLYFVLTTIFLHRNHPHSSPTSITSSGNNNNDHHNIHNNNNNKDSVQVTIFRKEQTTDVKVSNISANNDILIITHPGPKRGRLKSSANKNDTEHFKSVADKNEGKFARVKNGKIRSSGNTKSVEKSSTRDITVEQTGVCEKLVGKSQSKRSDTATSGAHKEKVLPLDTTNKTHLVSSNVTADDTNLRQGNTISTTRQKYLIYLCDNRRR
jgi:hypothetical protein